jgi:hypothetical protein
MFWTALSMRVYHFTIPYRFLFHTLGRGSPAEIALVYLLRKAYSVVAFTIVGFVLDRALPPPQRAGPPAWTRHAGLRAAAIVGALSAVIEVVQTFRGATESVWVHVGDVGFGALGGWLGASLSSRLSKRPSSR